MRFTTHNRSEMIDHDAAAERRARQQTLTVIRLRVLPEDNASAELVSCERYAARLTEAACLARYTKTRRNVHAEGQQVAANQACRGCEQGEERLG